MSTLNVDAGIRPGLLVRVHSVREFLGRFPTPVLDLLLRTGVALVFWKSGMAKIANWDLTVALFAEEYKVPVLSPDIAALAATAAELACPVMLVAGFGARFGAVALLGMTLVIQVFVYPTNWSEHLLWASILLYVLTRGAGAISLDHVVASWFRTHPRAGMPA